MTVRYDLLPRESSPDAKYLGFPKSLKLEGIDSKDAARVEISILGLGENDDITVRFQAGPKGEGGILTAYHDIVADAGSMRIRDLIDCRRLPIISSTSTAYQSVLAGERRKGTIELPNLRPPRKVVYRLTGS